MLPDLAPTEWVSIGGFSLSLGTLILRFIIKRPSARAHLTTAAILFALISVGISAIQSAQRASEVRHLANRITVVLGNQEKVAEQLLIELNYPDMKDFTSALASLERQGRIVSYVVDVQLPNQQKAPLRLWRANATQSP